MRVALLAVLLVVSSGCGGEPRERAADGAQRRSHEAQPAVASSNLEVAARDLLPATVTTSDASAHIARCLGAFGRPVRCFTLQARGGGQRLRDRRQRFLAAARARGWRLTRIQTAPAGSSTLVFRRGRLEGRVLLARSADVTIVFVSVPSAQLRRKPASSLRHARPASASPRPSDGFLGPYRGRRAADACGLLGTRLSKTSHA